jgi:hypothetical protein
MWAAFLVSACTSSKDVIAEVNTPTSSPTPDFTTSMFQECPLPCWVGIAPGVTKTEDAVAILEDEFGANIELSTTSRYQTDWILHDHPYIANGEIHSTDNQVVMGIMIDFHADSVTLKNIDALIGQPSMVKGIEMSGCSELVYPDHHIQVISNPSNGSFDLTTSVESLWLMDSNEYILYNVPTFIFVTGWKGYAASHYC